MTSNHISNLVRSVMRFGASQLGCDELLNRSLFMLDVGEDGQHDSEVAKKILYELYRISVDSQSSAISDQWGCGHNVSRYLSLIDKDCVIHAWNTGGYGDYSLVSGATNLDDIIVTIPQFVWCMAEEAAATYCLDKFLVKFSLRTASLNESGNLSDYVRRLYTSTLRILAVSSAERIESTKPYGPSSLTYVLGGISDDLAFDVARYVANINKN